MAEMSSIKRNIIKGMHKVMLDCNTATLYVTKREYVKLGCVDRLKLSMHLASCKYCRQFAKQSITISHHIAELSKVDESNYRHHLSKEQKNKMIKVIESQQLTS